MRPDTARSRRQADEGNRLDDILVGNIGGLGRRGGAPAPSHGHLLTSCEKNYIKKKRFRQVPAKELLPKKFCGTIIVISKRIYFLSGNTKAIRPWMKA